MSLEPLDKKVEAFGFKVIKCNGNKMAEVDAALAEAWKTEGPVCIISDTIKGYGISKYEGKAISHYGSFGADEAPSSRSTSTRSRTESFKEENYGNCMECLRCQ